MLWGLKQSFFYDRASTKHLNAALSVSKKTAWHLFRGHALLLASARGAHSLTISGSLVSKTNKQKRLQGDLFMYEKGAGGVIYQTGHF
jgi:hypothetical protein